MNTFKAVIIAGLIAAGVFGYYIWGMVMAIPGLAH